MARISSVVRRLGISLYTLILTLATAGKIYGGEHTISTHFDIWIEGANKVISTEYYSRDYHFSDTITGSAIFSVDVTMHQPTEENVNIYEGNLYLEFDWHVSGSYTIQSQVTSFDRIVPVRLGLKDEDGLRLITDQVQILDSTLPPPLRGIIRKELDKKLHALENILIDASSIVNALPTRTLATQANTIDYEFWIERPVLRTDWGSLFFGKIVDSCDDVPILLRIFCVKGYFLVLDMKLHALVKANLDHIGILQEQYDVKLQPQAVLDYQITDDLIDMTVERIDTFVADLPPWLADKITQALGEVRLPIYEGRIIDIINAAIPQEVDIEFVQPITLSNRVEKDRVRITFDINTSASAPSITISHKTPVNDHIISVSSTVRGELRFFQIRRSDGSLPEKGDLIKDDIASGNKIIIGKDGSHREKLPPLTPGKYFAHIMFDNGHDFTLKKSAVITVLQ